MVGPLIMGKGAVVSRDANSRIDYSRVIIAIIATGIEHDVERLWKLEELGISSPNKEEEDDEKALKHFQNTIEGKETGMYSVQWPWKKSEPEFLSNLGRLKSLVTKLMENNQNDQIKAYNEIIEQQLQQGIIGKAADPAAGQILHYLPHRAVIKPSKVSKRTPLLTLITVLRSERNPGAQPFEEMCRAMKKLNSESNEVNQKTSRSTQPTPNRSFASSSANAKSAGQSAKKNHNTPREQEKEMCRAMKKLNSESNEVNQKTSRSTQPTPNRSFASSSANAKSAGQSAKKNHNTPREQEKEFEDEKTLPPKMTENVENTTAMKGKNAADEKVIKNLATPNKERKHCRSTQGQHNQECKASHGEGIILEKTKRISNNPRDDSESGPDNTLWDIPTQMPFFQDEDESDNGHVTEKNQQSSKQNQWQLQSNQPFSPGDTLEGIPCEMPNFQEG
ncbi:hypothetical protein Tcan_15137 [Toxocara canis]|uniref:Uncharacterized protein n=1 Tax=Toxocara canis TaxID=6265 RepID=A0A0B2V818_TOXCA|nr:hypothetical protein Tcan_15137 [Toxocara canis]